MTLNAKGLISELQSNADPAQAAQLQRFFKTGPGEYGEGDRFLGVRVPRARSIAHKYASQMAAEDFQMLLNSRWHEVRLAALVIMRHNFKKADESGKKELYNLYVLNIGKGINNWDLVDLSCPNIVGAYLLDKDHQPLYALAQGGLWQKRVSIISTFWFLKSGQPGDTYNLAEKLIYEKHDLLQKAVGWALREMGKLDNQLLEHFLGDYAATMPRTALRYSLEKLPESKRQYYMNLKNR
jgi:3-methyladenine DNA glycosylase AlkD